MSAAESTSGAGNSSGGAKRSGQPRPKRASAARHDNASAATHDRVTATLAGQLTDLAEDVTDGLVSPRDLIVLTRDRIQEILDDAAERGRVTRTDANALVSELVRKGRQQTDDLITDLEQLLERGRDQIESATTRARRSGSVDRIVRGADRARRSVGVGPSFPIIGYDELTSAQVRERLPALCPAELRRLRDHERRHANRKTVLDAVDRALA